MRIALAAVSLAASLASFAPAGAAAAASGHPDSARVPGSWMRIGMTQPQVLTRTPSPLEAGPGSPGKATRQGDAMWFGVPSRVTLHFQGDVLTRAEFVVEDAAPYWIDYIQDQLRLAGYRPRCKQEPVSCDWQGTTHVRLEVRQRRVEAEITAHAPEPAAARVPRRPVATPVPARADTVPVFPDVFVLGRAAPPGGSGVPALVDSTPLMAPEYPARARAAGVQGRVWVRALIDTSGLVTATEIARSIPELDSAAVAVARRCRFRPWPPGAAPVRFQIEIPVTFRVR